MGEDQHVARFICATCGVENEIVFDAQGEKRLDQYEDCAVCCRSNLVRIFIDLETGKVTAEATDE